MEFSNQLSNELKLFSQTAKLLARARRTCMCQRCANVTHAALSFISGNRQTLQGKEQHDSFLNHLSIRIVYTEGLGPFSTDSEIQFGRRGFGRSVSLTSP